MTNKKRLTAAGSSKGQKEFELGIPGEYKDEEAEMPRSKMVNEVSSSTAAAERQSEQDPWKHRSRGMCCKTCLWFVYKNATVLRVGVASLGRCRKHAPCMSGYPVVFEQDWCGDHKLDENKM